MMLAASTPRAARVRRAPAASLQLRSSSALRRPASGMGRDETTDGRRRCGQAHATVVRQKPVAARPGSRRAGRPVAAPTGQPPGRSRARPPASTAHPPDRARGRTPASATAPGRPVSSRRADALATSAATATTSARAPPELRTPSASDSRVPARSADTPRREDGVKGMFARTYPCAHVHSRIPSAFSHQRIASR